MEFEEMKKIWDSQNNRPMYAIDENSLHNIVKRKINAASRKVNQTKKRTGVSIWQRNYYEHVIRDEEDYFRIREYIANNPEQWELDRENPKAKGSSQLEDDIFGVRE